MLKHTSIFSSQMPRFWENSQKQFQSMHSAHHIFQRLQLFGGYLVGFGHPREANVPGISAFPASYSMLLVGSCFWWPRQQVPHPDQDHFLQKRVHQTECHCQILSDTCSKSETSSAISKHAPSAWITFQHLIQSILTVNGIFSQKSNFSISPPPV